HRPRHGDPGRLGRGARRGGGDAGTADAVQAPSASRWVPYVDGAFERVFRPEGSRYLNDHSLIRGADGRWHLYGITDDSSGMPHAERSLLHATAASLRGPWSEEPDVLMTIGAEQVLWAPFVFPTEPGRWLMYFWAGTPDGRTQRAESTDLFRWTRSPRSAPGGRDPFVLRVGSEWFLYSVGVSEPVGAMAHGQILVTRSDDLEHWSTPSVALQDPSLSFGWGNLESPTVAVRDDGYYLFVTRTSEAPIDYARTVVFHSTDPARFAWAPVTEMLTHAAEVFEVDGQSYITAAGWTSMLGARWRGLSLAKLGWARRPGGG
ncbi:MAG: glycosyl hydrolase family 32, partial [Deltaproteobacteria bacterium]|nr:glycosyl hydrolase family 32 [Deltaproteobacteria bacterium]